MQFSQIDKLFGSYRAPYLLFHFNHVSYICMDYLQGVDFPKNLPEFDRRFATEADCAKYLLEQRWPDGFRCPTCNTEVGWLNKRGFFECGSCHKQTSLTAGTIMHGTRYPLTLWFRAIWRVCTQKTGLSAAGLKRLLGLKSMQTAWTWLQKMRQAMVRSDREPLEGFIHLDEARLGKKYDDETSWRSAIVAIAVETGPDGDAGRIRIWDVTAKPQAGLLQLALEEVSPRATLWTDSWEGYEYLGNLGIAWESISPTNDLAKPLARVSRVIVQVRRWLLGTHQGRVSRKHLQGYLDEFVFRYNRRKSPHVGLLFQRLIMQGVRSQAKTYKDFIIHD